MVANRKGPIEDVDAVSNIADEFYTEEFVREFFNYKNIATLRQIQNIRPPGAHPPCLRVGSSVKYPKKLFHQWVSDQSLKNSG